MNETVIVFGDVLEALCAHLATELQSRGWSADAFTRVPEVRPERFVRLVRTGGLRHPDRGVPVERAQVTVEAWAEDEGTAHDLAQVSRGVVHASVGVVGALQIYRVDEVSAPAWLPDDVSDQARFSFTVQVTVRGAPETGS